jgi:BMFP domain-containing protein YqiC
MKTFEDLVRSINDAHSEFDLARLSLADMKASVNDLAARLQALEAAEKARAATASAQGSLP